MRLHHYIAVLVVTVFVGINAFLFSNYFFFNEIRLVTQRGDTYDLKVELAKTFRQKQKGLMYRKRLEVGRGMLFVYDKPALPSFWMKNMRFPLDMIFIGEDLIIRHIAEKIPPCLEDKICPTYSSSEPVQYILEVPGGYSDLFKIHEGDYLELIDPI